MNTSHIEKLTLKEAQKLIFFSQKLLGEAPSPQETLEHLGYVQIDTISVVERAHHHVFWSRNSKYKTSDLDKLIASRKAFEYWSHAASYLPMKDYRFTLPMKKDFQNSCWFKKEPKVMKYVLKRIKEEGPLMSKDFKNKSTSKSAGWWDWKPAKVALDRLFLEGKLEISSRKGFQKVYDLPERVIPSSVNTKAPTQKEYLRFLIKRTLQHHGIANLDEIAYLKKSPLKNGLKKELQEMVSNQELLAINIKNVSETFFAFPKLLNASPRLNSKTHILSPFDNLVIQRKKLKNLFNFDYQIECYVPEAKRKYGYFSLPIFSGIQPIARVDCKTDRKEKTLLIQSLHYEQNIDPKKFQSKIDKQLKSFASFNGCLDYKY